VHSLDVFDLVAKIRLDSSEYEQGVGKAKGTFSTLASGVKTGLATVTKVGAAAVAAGTAGVVALTKMGIDGYKQYEQLAGGAELLWGNAYDFIADKASSAYENVQMSQNDYLQQVNGFAVGLKVALGGNEQAAAELADRIITAEADIVAATGATQENVQNAFNGIMKNNFSMVDNLGLGITATKEGFQTMIDSVNAYNAAHGKSTQYQIDNVADCQAALLDYIEMQGMSGYASAEAAGTIEGSVAMMKGAWSNLVVGMADDNANLEVLIGNFVGSVVTVKDNILPVAMQALEGIGTLITELAPVIAETIPVLVEEVLPSLLAAGISLITAIVKGVVTALPALYDALLIGVQTILVEVFGVSETKAGEFAASVNSFFVKIKDGFMALVESAQTEGTWLNSVWTGLKETGKAFCDFLVALWDVLSSAFTWCVEQINTEGTVLNTIWEHIKICISTAIDIIKGVIQVFTAVLQGDWSAAWSAVLNICSTIWDGIKSVVSNATSAVKTAISSGIETAKAAASEKLSSIREKFSSVFSSVKTTVSGALSGVKTAISSGLNSAKSTVFTILGNIKNKFSTIFSSAKTIVSDAVTALKKALKFDWSLPKLKLPHISVSGGKAPYGIGGKGSLPKFSIEWYKKAYDNAMILSSPTIFGYSAASGKFLGGGDGNGNEIVAGESYLMNLIGRVVEAKNGQTTKLLAAMLEAIVDGNGEMVRALNAGQVIILNERELGRAVRGLV